MLKYKDTRQKKWHASSERKCSGGDDQRWKIDENSFIDQLEWMRHLKILHEIWSGL